MKKTILSIASIIAGCALMIYFSGSMYASGHLDIQPLLPNAAVQENSEVVTVSDSVESGEPPAAVMLRNGYTLVCENAFLALYFENSEAGIAVKNKKDGSIWYSKPEGADNDPLADGSVIMSMSSHLIVDFVDEQNNTFKANSMASSVRQETFQAAADDKGITITFDFSRETEQFSIPVRYTLVEDSFQALIMYDKIKEYGKFKITNISLLPYFGAGGYNEDGYMLVPDGSGALVNFEDKFNTGSEYYEYVYGRDPALSYSKDIGVREAIRLPVFGITKQHSSFVAVISEGGATAGIVCRPVGLVSSYGAVFPCFTYRQLDVTVIADKSWKAREVKLLDTMPVTQSPAVRYYFTGDGGYSGMANRVRQYLMDTLDMKPKKRESTFGFLHLYGAVKKTESVGGIIRETTLPATTFSHADSLIANLSNNRVENLHIVLNGFNNGGMYHQVTDTINFDSVTGGSKQAVSFIQKAQSHAYKVYYAGQIMNLYQPSKGLRSFNAVAKTLNGDVLKLYRYKLSTGLKDAEIKPWSLLHYDRVLSLSKSLKASVEKSTLDGLVMQELSSLIYSDYDKSLRKDRTQAQQEIVSALQQLSKGDKDLVLSGGNMYALPYGDVVLDAPLTDSRFRIASQSVPFYQMVCHGLITMTGTPINAYVDTREALLRSLEGGMLPSYAITGVNPVELQNTQLENMYYTHTDMVSKLIISQYEEFSDAYKQINGEFISGHHILTSSFHITDFVSGKRLAINYGDAPVMYRHQRIPPQGFMVFQSAG